MSEEVEAVQAKEAQRQTAKRATLEQLRGKRRAEDEFEVELNGEPVSFLFRSIGSTVYDKLVTRHKPTTEQKAAGQPFNVDTFAPALLARVCVEPVLDDREWAEIWNSEDWNRGELMDLFGRAVALCNRGLDPAPIAAG